MDWQQTTMQRTVLGWSLQLYGIIVVENEQKNLVIFNFQV